MAVSVLLWAVGREGRDGTAVLDGLGAAIQAMREDGCMSPEKKEKGVDCWVEEGKQIGRHFTVEVIKAMFRGELPFF